MKICIAGIGAIGSYLAARLSLTSVQLSILVRPGKVDAFREKGISLHERSGEVRVAFPRVFSSGDAAEPQDWIFICAKAFAVPEIVASLGGLWGPSTNVIFVQNGVPSWYAQGRWNSNARLDPDGVVMSNVAQSQAVGCVAYANVLNEGAGVARHIEGDTFVIGRPGGSDNNSLKRLAEVMQEASIAAKISDNIEQEMWAKLWGSVAFNPISALTGATLDRIILEPSTRPLVVAMMRETQEIARLLGTEFSITVEQRLEAGARAGAFKTSMLQDIEAKRPLEIDAIIGAVSDAGHALGVPCTSIDAVLALLTQRADTLGLRSNADRS